MKFYSRFAVANFPAHTGKLSELHQVALHPPPKQLKEGVLQMLEEAKECEFQYTCTCMYIALNIHVAA